MEIEDLDNQSQNQPLRINEVDENFQICQNEVEGCEELIPYVGMGFSSVEEAYDFYNTYAKGKGFSIRKSDVTRLKSGEVSSRLYVCNKEGFKSMADKRRVGKEFKARRNERQGCHAKMRIHNNNGVWTIKDFVEEHNHDLLSTPSKVQLLRSHSTSHLDPTCKVLFDQFRSCGEGPSKIAKLVNATSGSNSVNITTQQCVDYFRSRRKSNVGHECLTMIEKLLRRQATDSQFYYSIEKDNDDICRSIFWADGRARTSYLHFGDVIVFDVTYKTNTFLLPFAPFTGVNHHRQSTLFGCALLADETEETFVWLFQQWLACMWDKAPVTIITDQDPAICNAVKRVFPNTCHRYCIWHIGLHEDEHLRSLRASYNPGFDKDYNNWAKYSQTIEESEEKWVILNQNYKQDFEEPLTEKQKSLNKSWKWLESMYNKRKHWVEAYLKDTFFAGMRSSQRSESMNSYFDGFVNSMTSLYEFVEQYDKAISTQRKKEEREDTICMRSHLDIRSMHELEAHAAKVYTRNLFEIFHVQFKNTWSCWHEKVCKDAEFVTYKVTSKIDGLEVSSLVVCNVSQQKFKCICGKFETHGILCSHILYIMKQKFHLQSIPDRYILPRWTLAFRYSTTSLGYIPDVTSNELSGKTVTPLQSWTLRATFDKIVHDASIDIERYGMALGLAKSYWENCDLMEEARPSSNSEGLTQIGSIAPDVIEWTIMEEPIHDPERAKTKGRPRAPSRIQSGKEISQTQAQTRTWFLVLLLQEMIFRGTDTVAILLEWIIARMVLHPEIQCKAQSEIDYVVGSRAVSDSDIARLPWEGNGLATVHLWLAQLLQNFKWLPTDGGVNLDECLKMSLELKNPLVCRIVPRS